MRIPFVALLCSALLLGCVKRERDASGHASPNAAAPSSSPPVEVSASERTRITAHQKKSIDEFLRGYQYLQSINLLQQGIRSSKDIEGDFEKLLALMRAALRSFEDVDPAALNSVHPDWGTMISRNVVPALRLYLSGSQSRGNRSDLARGDALISEFDIWLERNWNAIASKVEE